MYLLFYIQFLGLGHFIFKLKLIIYMHIHTPKRHVELNASRWCAVQFTYMCHG